MKRKKNYEIRVKSYSTTRDTQIQINASKTNRKTNYKILEDTQEKPLMKMENKRRTVGK